MELSKSIFYPPAILEGINQLANQVPEGSAPKIGFGRSSDPYGTVTIMLLTLAYGGQIDTPEDKQTFRKVSQFVAEAKAYTEETGATRIYGDAEELAHFTRSPRFELTEYTD